MRRLLRWTFNTLAAASLLLCLATAALWVRSYWACDQFYAERQEAKSRLPYYDCVLVSYRGQLVGSFSWSEWREDQPTLRWRFGIDHPRDSSPELRPGFGFDTIRRSWHGYEIDDVGVRMPTWSLVAAFALLPAVATFRQFRAVRRRRRRSRLGLCPACGYDLRASPGRCPECGREGG